LKKHYDIICWTSYHYRIIYFIVVPTIVVWIVAFPLLILYLLWKNRDNLDSPDNLIKYGMFFIGLKDEYYYWEILIINIRKILATAISVSINQKNQFLASLLYTILLFGN
jgi:hypothetical protein